MRPPLSGLFRELDYIRNKGELVVCMSAEEMRYFHLKNARNVLEGLDVDVAKSLAKALGVQLRIEADAKSYEEVIDRVHKGQADLGISMLSFTPRRSTKVLYAPSPYMELNAAAIVNRVYLAKKRSMTLRQLLEEPDALIGIHQNTYYEDYTKTNFPHAKYKYFKYWADLTRAVVDGAVSAAFFDHLSLEEFLENDFSVNLKVLPLKLKDLDEIYVVCAPYYTHLSSWIDLVLKNNSITQITYDDMKNRYGHGNHP